MEINTIRVLLVDDDKGDYIITQDFLDDIEGNQYELDWVAHYDDALKAIKLNEHDVYLLDYRLRGHTGLDLLNDLTTENYKVPIILLTGQGDHDVDIEAMNAGAMDFLVKGEIDSKSLERSIRYAMMRNHVEKEHEKLILELEEALERIKTLDGLLPICAHCKKIRDDSGYWNQIERYITTHSKAEFSHSICPTCTQQLYPDLYDKLHLDQPR